LALSGKKYDTRGFAAERLQCSVLFCPRHLVECNAETAHHARKVQKRTDLALVLREAVIGERNYGEGPLNYHVRGRI